MTANEFPAKPKAYSLIAAEPKSISILLANSDPEVRAQIQSIRDEAQAHFAAYLEEHALEAKGTSKRDNEYRIATHRSSLFDPHTHSHHLIIATPPKEEKP